MEIIKRDGQRQAYHQEKIANAVRKAFLGSGFSITEEKLANIVKEVENFLATQQGAVAVEAIQDQVEKALMSHGYYEVSKNYILYRHMRGQKRSVRKNIVKNFEGKKELENVLAKIQKDFVDDEYGLEKLERKFDSFKTVHMQEAELYEALMKSAVELTTQEAPKWEFIAARLLMLRHQENTEKMIQSHGFERFSEKIHFLVKEELYGAYILENYTDEELNQASTYMDDSRNERFTYSGLDLLLRRYVITDHQLHPLETPQEMFLGIALHLAMPEKTDRLGWVKKFYDMLSTLKVTMATPTLANARKPFHQMSSCFIDTVPDSLTGIYRSIDNFAQVSKFGGGMGLYFGKVRAKGGEIRGFQGAAGGIIRWIKLANDTAVAVDQLGVRQGAVAVYLDVWHKDLPEFLSLRTNNGDDRMKAHDVFPAVCYPDLFWKIARDNINENWYLMCPHEIQKVKGYALEDSFGDEWEEKYRDCVKDTHIDKRVIPIKEIIRLIIKSAVETGTPFVFNRDSVNKANPNPHKGMIYCSNLCTEIAQNMREIADVEQRIETIDGETVVVTVTKPGDFVVCNLASLSLGHIDVNNPEEIKEITFSAVRALDNVISLNFFPVPYAKINNEQYRPIGLGVSGYHHMLAKNQIRWESEEHLTFVDQLFEQINYAAIQASCQLGQEKGVYAHFAGSDWENGAYFSKRNYHSEKWLRLKEQVAKNGLRNAWLLAVAPTSSTSILSGTSPGIDPIMTTFFFEEKKEGLLPRVAPDLSAETRWFYKNAHAIDQTWSIRAAGVRQRHIDQAQSMNVYITNDFTFKQLLQLYILAFEQGVKTLYYVRSKSLEVEDCESCSA
ncbi:MAG: ribonucleoside-diphosphate reductase subunit alpha [Clostridiales bacterium]|nr:ribonucleoside-diphosphate reductase subunit alpha [Clostridiales bacterium]